MSAVALDETIDHDWWEAHYAPVADEPPAFAIVSGVLKNRTPAQKRATQRRIARDQAKRSAERAEWMREGQLALVEAGQLHGVDVEMAGLLVEGLFDAEYPDPRWAEQETYDDAFGPAVRDPRAAARLAYHYDLIDAPPITRLAFMQQMEWAAEHGDDVRPLELDVGAELEAYAVNVRRDLGCHHAYDVAGETLCRKVPGHASPWHAHGHGSSYVAWTDDGQSTRHYQAPHYYPPPVRVRDRVPPKRTRVARTAPKRTDYADAPRSPYARTRPIRNRYARPCERCHLLVEVGEGLAYPPDPSVGIAHWRTTHNDAAACDAADTAATQAVPLMSLGAMLKRGRELAGATQADVAECIGVGQSTVSTWETGDEHPSPARLLDVCTLLELDVAVALRVMVDEQRAT